MARINKTLSFPSGGVVRRENYREQNRPYSAPWAVNVRGVDVLESRNRGGSRPGLTALAVSTQTTGTFLWPEGTVMQWPSSPTIDYATDELITVTSPAGTIVSPATLLTAVAKVGTVPASYTISCVYRDRLILGAGALWYASRMGDHEDWNYGADMDDTARAVFGTVALAGVTTGNSITALIPFRDKALIIATRNSLHILEGDPATGNLRTIDENIGIISSCAWAIGGEMIAFLSNDGVYIGGIGQKPNRFSSLLIPANLKNVLYSSTSTISMVYDAGTNGFYLFITPSSGTGQHYFIDVDNKAIWPIVFGYSDHQPVAATVLKITASSLDPVVIKSRSGGWLKIDDSATTDNGGIIQSHVLIGPVRLTSDDTKDAILNELHGIMGTGSATVTWRIVMGDSAEVAVDNAVSDMNLVLAGSATQYVVASGTWAAARNYVAHPRARGTWMVVWLSASSKWAYESVTLVAEQLGRNR